LYKTTDYFSLDHERFISWSDPDINIVWPLVGEPLLSGKDSVTSLLRHAEVFK
jgi:dTDP-4-dehydrorhamnose 3,5-epimerase